MQAALTHLALHVRNLDRCIAFYSSYCGMMIAHDRLDRGKRIVWLAEQGKQDEFILVFIPGGPGRNQREDDFSHLGFALDSRDAVGVLAARARGEGILEWEPRDEPYPVGYYCGIKDPDGNFVEFSYGQPLGRAHSPRLDVTGRRHGAELTLGFSDALFHHPRVAATINYGPPPDPHARPLPSPAPWRSPDPRSMRDWRCA